LRQKEYERESLSTREKKNLKKKPQERMCVREKNEEKGRMEMEMEP
jgi:hypothetical protein